MNLRKLVIPFAALVLALTLADSSAQPPKAKSKPDEKAMAVVMTFECYRDPSGTFRYRLKEGDVTIGIASKGYESMAECRKICETIQKNAVRAKIVETVERGEK